MRTRHVWLPTLIGSLILTTPALALDDDARSPEAVEAARKLMGEVGKAYATAPALTDEMTVTFVMPGMGEQSFSSGMRFAGNNAEVTGLMDMLNLYVVEGTLYATSEFSDGAVSTDLGDEPVGVVTGVLGEDMQGFAPPQLLFRLGATPDAVEPLLGFGIVEEPTITGHTMVDGDNGAKWHEVLINGSGDGTMSLYVDADTKLIVKSVTSGLPEGFPGTEPITVTTTYQPVIMAKLDSPIEFDAGDREMFEDLDAMMMASRGDMSNINPSIEVGSEAPSFALVDQDGEMHKLDQYRGQVVVLDWWGVW